MYDGEMKKRLGHGVISVSAVRSLQCFDTDGCRNERHLVCKNLVPLIPEVLFQNKLRRDPVGTGREHVKQE